MGRGCISLPCSKLVLLSWPLLSLLLWLPSSAALLKTPELGIVGRRRASDQMSSSSYDDVEALAADGFETRYYTQTLDHFNYRPESYTTFQQRYVINFKYWGGSNTSAPIFVYTGDEAGLENDIYFAGFLTDNAPRYKSLLVYIEHRYYGESVPFGTTEEAFRNASTLGYFSSTQALADYAELIIDLKKNLSAENCPVITFGGSYGGMLASWFRLKYPHIAIGGMASSAPILYFEDITPENGYYSVVTKDFREASETCYTAIRNSWFEIDAIASQPNGLTLLSQKFNTCSPLSNTEELKDNLRIIYMASAQYDYPPDYPVNVICNAIDGAPQGTDVLGRIFAAIVANQEKRQCFEIIDSNNETSGRIGPWHWQKCTEMVFPIGCGSNDTMFQARPFDLKKYTKDCRNLVGVVPRPHWITTEFGGHDIKSVLQRFGSNIIFSNGLRDPYSSGGVLHNISDSIVAVYTTEGAHCMDIFGTKPTDPEWVILQRKAEAKIIDGWLQQYNAELVAS